ncbi:MAG: hypothetical protein J7545_15640 [Roseofilum sp. SBFL]|uniref:hypothetical protein n=1 Tax=Roseofilum sp. SBFL TaxID=2821496 RepID=UPI001B1A67B2|nr:hypothetical protein [Roseofilum sp. SBFL]MBP0043380.1 hypothetical protein [Roseofilum sp. SBFL]
MARITRGAMKYVEWDAAPENYSLAVLKRRLERTKIIFERLKRRLKEGDDRETIA